MKPKSLELGPVLEYLFSVEARKLFRDGLELHVLNAYSEFILDSIIDPRRKGKLKHKNIIALGGEAICLLAYCNLCSRYVVFKVGFNEANQKGQEIIEHGETPKDTKKFYFNIVKERFIRGGAQIQSNISEYIPRVYGIIPYIYAAIDNPAYIEMEYVEGNCPYQYFKEKDFRIIFEWFYRLLVLISLVHRNVLHRDIKISNLLVVETEQGLQPSLIDWTFSKINKQSKKDDLTHYANVYFTIHSGIYSSPKFVSGDSENANESDDVYSLGKVMYILFARHLVRSENEINLEKLPSGSKEIYLKATAKEESQRYQNVDEFIQDLEEFAYKIDIDPEYIESLKYPTVTISNNHQKEVIEHSIKDIEKIEDIFTFDVSVIKKDKIKKLIYHSLQIVKFCKENDFIVKGIEDEE